MMTFDPFNAPRLGEREQPRSVMAPLPRRPQPAVVMRLRRTNAKRGQSWLMGNITILIVETLATWLAVG